MSILDKQKDVLGLIEKLDITPTMYKNAIEKYNHLAKYLSDNGIRAEIYPQGSFALGTVVRPIIKNEDASYDLDFICQVNDDKQNLTPRELRNKVLRIIENSKLYEKNLKVYDECFTITFANVNGIGFSIDIVPAVPESGDIIARLVSKSYNPEIIETAIAIPKYSNSNFSWITNNPIGYRNWFEKINNKFNETSKYEYRQMLFGSNKHIFNSIQEIPEGLERSALQRVIQILKYHRDVYYSKRTNGDKLKPISAIINTIVTKIADTAIPQTNTFDLLKYVLDEFTIYSEQQTLNEVLFASKYSTRNIILKKSDKWVITNPANPEDNLADHWDNKTADAFFMWVRSAKKDLLESLNGSDAEFRVMVENAFGKKLVEECFRDKYKVAPPKPINSNSVAKPWGQ